MDKLRISKTEFLALAAIVAKRASQDETLQLENLPTCWKIQSVHPVTEHLTLVAYIPKIQSNEHYSFPTDYRRTPALDCVDGSKAPTLHRNAGRFNKGSSANRPASPSDH